MANVIRLDNLDDRDGAVMVTLDGPDAFGIVAYWGSVNGSRWEQAGGGQFFYVLPPDTTETYAEIVGLIDSVNADLADLDLNDDDTYCPPDDNS